MIKSIVAVILLTTSTAGCVTAVFDERACPRERDYTAEEQAQIGKELRLAGPHVRSAFVDYGKLRDKSRACRGETVRP